MPNLKQYVGLDVSLAETSIAVIDEADKVVWRGSVASIRTCSRRSCTVESRRSGTSCCFAPATGWCGPAVN